MIPEDAGPIRRIVALAVASFVRRGESTHVLLACGGRRAAVDRGERGLGTLLAR